MSAEKIMVTTKHVRAAGMCLGITARSFFKRHNLNFRNFIESGIDADALLATGDAIVLAAVDIAKQEYINNG